MGTFNLPDLGEGLPDAEIRTWYVSEGDSVNVDDPIVAMETAKAIVDVPSPFAGTIAKLHGKDGDIIHTGQPLVSYIDENGSPSTNKPAAATVVGTIEQGDTVLQESATGITPAKKANGVKALPSVRNLAKHLAVDLNRLQGSGKNGEITADDVKHAVSLSTPAPSASTADGNWHPLRGIQRNMARTMSYAHEHVVKVTINDDAMLGAWKEHEDITVRVIRAIKAGITAEPTLNAWFDDNKQRRQEFKALHLGLAIDSPEGLLVPVIKDAQDKSDQELRACIQAYKQQAQDRSLAPEALQGATISLSNFGKFAGRYADPIVVPPTVAIVATGKLRDTVVVHDGESLVEPVLPISLSFDHRAVSGGEAARFLAALIAALEKP